MAWTSFSAEAIELHAQVRKLERQGRISDMIDVIKAALEKAHREGPSNESYADFEAKLEREFLPDSTDSAG
jgi:hypothetical protein